jgi:hypothetical protein
MGDPQFQIRIVSEAHCIDLISDVAARPDIQAEFGRPREVSDASNLGFDLAVASELIGVVANIGALAELLVQVFKTKVPRVIVIESPLGSVKFRPTRDMTDAEIRRITKRLANIA